MKPLRIHFITSLKEHVEKSATNDTFVVDDDAVSLRLASMNMNFLTMTTPQIYA